MGLLLLLLLLPWNEPEMAAKASRRWVQNTMQIFTLRRDSSNDTHLYRLRVGYCWVTGGGQSREGQQVKLAEFE